MSSTDNRIVRMIFDNATFKRAAEETKSKLESVNAAIDRAGKSKGLLNLNKNMQEVAINASKMQVATAAAIGTIASKATAAASNTLKSLTLDPIMGGFREYEALLTKQNTIMNSTGKSAEEVKSVLTDLNKYSDQTVFKFSDMTDAITKFTNAGVPLKKAERSIRGIANAAAFAGLGSEEAGRAFYAFSQSMSTGYLMLQDWNQLDNAGFGNMRFKSEVIAAAEALGTLNREGNKWVTDNGKVVTAKNFRNTLSEQWATTEVLNKALNKYADTNTKLGKKAFESATEVRTFTAFMGTLRESIESGWASVFTEVFGGLEESTAMWTKLSGAVGGVIQGYFNFLAASLRVWRQMGGAAKIGQALQNALSPIGALFKAIGDAWRNAFGGETGEGAGSTLYAISYALELMTRPLAWLAKLISMLEYPLTGFFFILKGGGIVIGDVVKFLGSLVKAVMDVITFKMPSIDKPDNIIGWIVALGREIARTIRFVQDMVAEGASIKEIFTGLANFDFKMPDLPDIQNWFKNIKLPKITFPGFEMPKFSLPGLDNLFGGGGGKDEPATQISAINDKIVELSSTSKALDYVMTGLSENSILGGSEQGFGEFMSTNLRELEQAGTVASDAFNDAKDAGEGFWDMIKRVGGAIASFFGLIEGEDIVHSLNFAVLATIGVTAAKMFSNFSNVLGAFKDIGQNVNGVLDGVGDALKSFQTAARAQLILNIGIAIGILAVSLWILSRIPQDKILTALGSLAGVIALMSALLYVMSKTIGKFAGKGTTGKLIALGAAMTLIALSMLIMAAAMRIMNGVDIDTVLMTLLTLAVIFKGMENIGNLAEKSGRKLVAAGAAMVLIGGALIILAGAMLLFKLVDYESMTKAGLVIAALTTALFLLGQVPYKALAKAGTSMLAISVGMLVLANALLLFQLVQWESIAKAGVVLLGLSVAMIIMSRGMGVQGAAVILAVGAAFVAIALGALMLQRVSWETLAKAGAVLLGLALIFGIFMGIVMATLPAVAALTGLALGLAALAAAAALLAFAFAIILPLLAAGIGLFAAFAAAAAVAIAVFLQTLATEMPTIIKAVGKIIDGILQILVENYPKILDAILKMADIVIDRIPDFVEAAVRLITAFVDGLADNIDPLVQSGVNFVEKLLQGIASQSNGIVQAAIDFLITLGNGILDNADRLIDAGIDLFVKFLDMMAGNMRDAGSEIGGSIANLIASFAELGVDLIEGIGEGMGRAAVSSALAPWKVVGSVLKGAYEQGKKEIGAQSPSRLFMNIGKFMAEGIGVGVQNYAAAAINSVASMLAGQVRTAEEYISAFVQRLEQRSIAARATAEGLARAAERAAEAADKTEKNKKDDAAAAKLEKQAEAASERADKAEEKAQRAADKANREREFQEASTLEKAKMRSEDAQTSIEDAKAAEARAAAAVAEANALAKQIKSNKYSEAEEKAMQKRADRLRLEAKAEALLANKLMAEAQKNAAAALALQKKAGAEAALEYQKQFDAEARADAEADAFDALSDTDKAVKRRADAAALQAESQKNLAQAKKLAYTDIEAANELARLAMDQADQARDYLKDAVGYEKAVADAAKQAAEAAAAEKPVEEEKKITPTVDLTASDQAALAFANLAELYNASTAAAAAGTTVEFNQYNTSPESLSPTEVYRQTNNLLTHAYERLGQAA